MRIIVALFLTCLGCLGQAFGPADPTVKSWGFVAPAAGGGGITLDALTLGTNNGSGSFSWSHTVASGAVLVIFASANGTATTVTNVSYNGIWTTNLLADTDHSEGIVAKLSVWIAHNPASGAHSITVYLSTPTSAGADMGIAASFTGVANSTAAATHRTIYHDGVGGGGKNITVIDSVSGDMVVAATSSWGANPTSSQTAMGIIYNVLGSAYDLVGGRTVAVGASTVMSWVNDDWVTAAGFALIPQ